MFLFNLSFVEFMALFTAVSGLVVALYLLSRSRQKHTVPTLRFWIQAKQPVPAKRRRRIQQPWSLILQLLSIALLLLAIAQLKLGSRQFASRDHVLLLDASSWMGARSRNGTLLDEAKAKARAFVRALPSSDRVMLVRVDALASPVTGMESDHATVLRAIDETRPGASALNLEQAFRFAEQIRKLHASPEGEVVYAGARRIAAGVAQVPSTMKLRLLDVESPSENVGISKIGARRSEDDPELWEIFVAVRNYGTAQRRIPVALQYGGAPAGSAVLQVAPGSTESRTFQLRTRAAGWIETRVLLTDALEEDNRAILELPALKNVRVAVFSDDAEAIRPALAAHPQIEATYHTPSQFSENVQAQVLVLDRFSPSSAPKVPVIWIEPPDAAPFRTRSRISEERTVRWRSDHEVVTGIRSRGMRLQGVQILATAKDDVPVADIDGGPVVLLRPSQRAVALGFHPGRTEMRYDLATPLLLANLLRWIEPDVFRSSEVHGSTVGTVTVPIDRNVDPKQVRVLADSVELPYTLQSDSLRFFSGSPGVVRVLAGNREQVYSLSLPEVGDRVWDPVSPVRRGIPGVFSQAISRDLWQLLALTGGILLLIEWLLFGRKRIAAARQAPATAPTSGSWWRKAS